MAAPRRSEVTRGAAAGDRGRRIRCSAMVAIALGVVYLVWGSTYFAIAIMVQTLPPALAAGVRFLVAGVLLTLWIVVTFSRSQMVFAIFYMSRTAQQLAAA